MAWWSSVVSSVAFAIAIAVATFSWPRMRLFSIAVMAWCAAAWAFSRGGFFHDAGGWHAADIPGFLLFGSLMTLPLISLFQVPLSIAIHLLALRRLMSPG